MPRSNNKQQLKAKATIVTSRKSINKKKKNTSAKTTTDNSKHVEKMSRQQLIKSLAEIGILTPGTIKIDMLRLLYEANINEGQKKHDNNSPTSSTTSYDEHVQIVTGSAREETDAAQDHFSSSQLLGNEKVQVNDSDHRPFFC